MEGDNAVRGRGRDLGRDSRAALVDGLPAYRFMAEGAVPRREARGPASPGKGGGERNKYCALRTCVVCRRSNSESRGAHRRAIACSGGPS